MVYLKNGWFFITFIDRISGFVLGCKNKTQNSLYTCPLSSLVVNILGPFENNFRYVSHMHPNTWVFIT